MNDTNTTTMDAAPARPSMLTILCILSFVWSGFSIIAGIIGYGFMKMMASGKIQDMVAQTGDTSSMSKFEEAQAKMQATGLNMDQLASESLVAVGFAIVALIGVIMMWKLRRTGFFIYLAAQVIAFAVPLMMGGKLDMSWTVMLSMALSLLFIILYAVNLKHMR